VDFSRLVTRQTIGVQAAALPLQCAPSGRVAVGLVTSRGTGRWVLPKGWLERGTSLRKTAEIEAWEEAGLVGEVAREPIGKYHYRKTLHALSSMTCEVHVFPLLVREQLSSWSEKKQRRVAFFWPEAAADSVEEPELADLLRNLHALVPPCPVRVP
jgi:8-oxo-dGTP pyrophosphatase MutT (NUDIX family)